MTTMSPHSTDQLPYQNRAAAQLSESQNDSSLPMVVNLRGDEDFVDEFSVDAQEAMDFLGIKRSRLTQISGRELRVGRIRRDRYLRPVYRQKDLEDYQRWTRSTATHQSSSKIVEHAIQKLEQQCEEFEKVTKESLQDNLEDLVLAAQRSLLVQVEKSMRQVQHSVQSAESSQAQQTRHTHRQLAALNRAETSLQSLLKSLQDRQELAHEILSQLHQVIREASVSLADLRDHVQTLLSEQRQTQQELRDELQQQRQFYLERQKQTDQQWQASFRSLSERLEQLAQEQVEREERLLAALPKALPQQPVAPVREAVRPRQKMMRRRPYWLRRGRQPPSASRGMGK